MPRTKQANNGFNSRDLLHRTGTYLIDNLVFWRKKLQENPGVEMNGLAEESPHAQKRKQRDLEKLCEKLFEKKNLIASGRLQLLGLDKIQLRLGKAWPGLQDFVYEICEKVMDKYLAKGDIFFRYQQSDYILLFSEASLPEADIKLTLISEEIRRELFLQDSLHEIKIERQVAEISADLINDANKAFPFPDSLILTFESSISRYEVETDAFPTPDISRIKKTNIEAGAYDRDVAPLDLGFTIQKINPSVIKYLPVWDNGKKSLLGCLYLIAGQKELGNPLGRYKKLCDAKVPSEKAKGDISMLNFIMETIAELGDDLSRKIICPVHYDTLGPREDGKNSLIQCQKMNERMRRHILFMVLNVPVQTSWLNLSKIISPLKAYGRMMIAELPIVPDMDFNMLRQSGFDEVAFIMEADASTMPQRKRARLKAITDIRSFIARAKRNRLASEIFVFGTDYPVMALSLADAGVRYLAGNAVHADIAALETRLDFEGNNSFRIWQRSMEVRLSG